MQRPEKPRRPRGDWKALVVLMLVAAGMAMLTVQMALVRGRRPPRGLQVRGAAPEERGDDGGDDCYRQVRKGATRECKAMAGVARAFVLSDAGSLRALNSTLRRGHLRDVSRVQAEHMMSDVALLLDVLEWEASEEAARRGVASSQEDLWVLQLNPRFRTNATRKKTP